MCCAPFEIHCCYVSKAKGGLLVLLILVLFLFLPVLTQPVYYSETVGRLLRGQSALEAQNLYIYPFFEGDGLTGESGDRAFKLGNTPCRPSLSCCHCIQTSLRDLVFASIITFSKYMKLAIVRSAMRNVVIVTKCKGFFYDLYRDDDDDDDDDDGWWMMGWWWWWWWWMMDDG